VQIITTIQTSITTSYSTWTSSSASVQVNIQDALTFAAPMLQKIFGHFFFIVIK
jgi:hypothetical protein